MKWNMEVKDSSLLHTPTVILKSPFCEIVKPIKAADEFGSCNTSLMSEVGNCSRKRKMKLTVSERNEKRQSKKKRSSTINGKTKSSQAEGEELFSLQIQKAMIADEDGDRPIHIAAAQGDKHLMKKLCRIMRKGGAPIDVRNSLKQSPLHVAVISANHRAISVLLRSGASLKLQDRNGYNAFHLGVKYFSAKAFTTLLSYCRSSTILDACDYDGLSALHHAVNRRNCTAVRGLCKAGANVDVGDGKSGRSSLAHASLSGHLDMVNILLECKASIERMDYSGQTVLELALLTGNRTIIKRLEKESSPDTPYKSNLDSGRNTTNSHRKRKNQIKSSIQETVTEH